MRIQERDTLIHQAHALRAAELRRIARAISIKWSALMHLSRGSKPPVRARPKDPDRRHAPQPCQVPAPSHP